jgi:hypothetical protein
MLTMVLDKIYFIICVKKVVASIAFEYVLNFPYLKNQLDVSLNSNKSR